MDYEKKYKDALSWIKDVYPTFEGAVKEDAEHFFPELKESEDERIRKAILMGLIDCRDAPDLRWSDFGGIPIDDCIDWLEKQEEQNPAWSEEDEEILNRIRVIVRNDNSSKAEDILWLKSLKERIKGR